MQRTFWTETLKEKSYWEHLGVDGKLRLKFAFQQRMKW